MSDINLAIAWYRATQWSLLKSVVADPDVIEDTYLEWLEVAEARVAELEELGLEANKVDVDVEEMVAWCKTRDMPLDGRARAQFVGVKYQGSI